MQRYFRSETLKTACALLLCAIVLLAPSGSSFARGGGGCGGGGCGGGGTVIDPPIGALFKDPIEAGNASSVPGEVVVDLKAQIAPVNVNGTTANLMTYNGCFPGPTIRVKRGEKLKINFTNGLPATTATNILGYTKNVTNLHTHGLHTSPEEPADYTMYELEPGQTYHHEYETSMQEGGCLNFYHGHKHGVSAEQYWAGMVGALVVEDETPLLSSYETHIMVLKDIALSGNQPAPHSTMMDFMHGKEGNIVMVNGQVNPRLYIKKGQVQRWRILNASNARFYRLALDGHTMQLIGTDGGLLDKPYAKSEIILSPGERVDLLVKGTQSTGNYRFKALPYSRMGNMGGETITLLTATYKGSVSPAQGVPSVINPEAMRLSVNTSMLTKRTISLSMGQGNGYINGQDFDVDPYTIMSHLGTFEVWTIVNQSGMDHPFHQHVNPAQVIAVSGGDPGYASTYLGTPAWKDTVLVPKWGSVTLLIPVMDYPGMAMFHCHILEHEDIGMMGMWHIMGDMPMPM